MKQLIAATILMLASLSAVANQLSAEGLTEAQAAQVAAEVAKLRAENTQRGVGQVIENLTADDITRYTEMGQAITTTITETAKGLGMAVDDFMGTSTGAMVMFLVVYHFFGSDILTLVLGLTILMPLTVWASNRAVHAIAIDGYKLNDKGKKEPVYRHTINSDARCGMVVIRIVTIIVLVIQFINILP